eukprot:3325392-Pyramimonas_sp.AAC.1
MYDAVVTEANSLPHGVPWDRVRPPDQGDPAGRRSSAGVATAYDIAAMHAGNDKHKRLSVFVVRIEKPVNNRIHKSAQVGSLYASKSLLTTEYTKALQVGS